MKKVISVILIVIFLISMISIVSVSALTGAIGNARMILRPDIGDTVHRSILVKNVNELNKLKKDENSKIKKNKVKDSNVIKQN